MANPRPAGAEDGATNESGKHNADEQPSSPTAASVVEATESNGAAEPVEHRPTAFVPRVSMHASGSVGVGSVGEATAAGRASLTHLQWFLPNVGAGVDLEMAGQTTVKWGDSRSHSHLGLSLALAMRAVHHRQVLFVVTAGAYIGHEEDVYRSPANGESVGALLGLRVGYMAQLRWAEIGPIIAVDTAIRPGLGPALAATTGLQFGFGAGRHK